MNAACQLHVTDSQTTRGGVIMAPIEVPVRNQPDAIERSFGGNQTVAVLTADGMAAASPMARMPRKSAEEGHYIPTARECVERGSRSPDQGKHEIPQSEPDEVGYIACDGLHQGVADLEGCDDE